MSRPISVRIERCGSRRCRHRVLILAACLLASGAQVGRAQSPPALADGIRAYTQVEYQAALSQLKTALYQVTRREDLALTYFYLGCTHLALEQHAQAREMYETLLSFDPGYVPNSRLTSPKITRFFTEVRRSFAVPDGPPVLRHRPPAQADPRLTHLDLLVDNLSSRLRPMLRYRTGASPSFVAVDARLRSAARARFVVPIPDGAGELFYYFVLADRRDVVVQRLRGPDRPFRLEVAERGRSAAVGAPWYKRWWFWTAVGAALVGTGLGLGFGLSGEQTTTAEISVLRRDPSGAAVPIFAP